MKNAFISLLRSIVSLFPMRNIIIFESVPDMEGNSRAVFDEMMKLNLNKDYRLVWLVDNKKPFDYYKSENVYFDYKPTNFLKKVLYLCKYANVKVKITENACYPKVHYRTVALHLGHGTAIKNTGSLMHIDNKADYVLYQSDSVKNISSELYNLKENQLISLGYPRNDNLIKGSKMNTDENFIIWLPTFRKSNTTDRTDSDFDFPLGLPIFKDISEVNRLNLILQQYDFTLYIKPHFAANLDTLKVMDFSHVKIIDDNYYKNKNLLFYEFLGMSKALITDYSSVYFDYLLLNKPIGITIDDLEQYQKGIGFVFEDFKKTILGEFIESYSDLEEYILGCVNSSIEHSYLDERKNEFNNFTDDQSAVRVVEFLSEKANL